MFNHYELFAIQKITPISTIDNYVNEISKTPIPNIFYMFITASVI